MDCSVTGFSVHGFPRQKSWMVASSLSTDLPHPGVEHDSPSLLHWQADSLPLSHHGNPTSRSLWQKLCAGLHELPFHHNHIYTHLPPYFFGAVSLSHLKCHLPGYSPHFAPNKTELGTSHVVHFLSQHSGVFLYTKTLWWSSKPDLKFAKFAPPWVFKLCFAP